MHVGFCSYLAELLQFLVAVETPGAFPLLAFWRHDMLSLFPIGVTLAPDASDLFLLLYLLHIHLIIPLFIKQFIRENERRGRDSKVNSDSCPLNV